MYFSKVQKGQTLREHKELALAWVNPRAKPKQITYPTLIL